MTNKRTFVYKLIIVAVIVLLTDMGFGKLLQQTYFKIKDGEQGRLSYAADSCRQDIVILGSSRASHHYIPVLITDSLRLSCYNAGKDKQGIYYSLAVLKMILKRHPPKLIILDLNPDIFAPSENGLDAISVLLPYYRMHPEIRTILNKRGIWEPVKTYSSLYNYNSLLLQILFNRFVVSSDTSAFAANGYVPISHTFSESIDSVKLLNHIAETPDSSLVNVFKQIIQATASHDCKLVVISSPVFSTLQRPSPAVETARQICQQEQIPFFDYATKGFFSGKAFLFSDAYHLNQNGAILFTQMLCSDLKRLTVVKTLR